MPGNDASPIVLEDGGAWVASWETFVLRTAFQPIFTFDRGRLVPSAFEALLRPFHGEEEIPPMIFLGELTTMNKLAVESLAHRLHLLNADAFVPAGAEIFINIDPSIFVDHAIADAAIHEMRVTLSEIGIDATCVVCEITEKRAISQEALFSLAALLRASGFRLAVDDFGAEESDMTRIRDLRPDVVKFDADWVLRLMGTDAGLALLATMIATFEKQGARTVFEGIEHRWQIELAETTGVSMIQGFALGRPLIVPDAFVSGPDEPPTAGAPAFAAGARTRPNRTRPFGRRNRHQ